MNIYTYRSKRYEYTSKYSILGIEMKINISNYFLDEAGFNNRFFWLYERKKVSFMRIYISK